MNVTLKHLRAFVEVARQRSFTRAAARLTLSQPALTITMRQLEEQLGVALFDRTTRQVALTAEGHDFLPTAERLLADFDTAVEDIRAVADRRRGRLSLSVLPSVAVQILPRIVSAFIERYPGITIHQHDDNSSGVLNRVRRGEVDFGLGGSMGVEPDLDFERLLRDRFVVVCRRDHPLARTHALVSWEELAEHRFLGLSGDTGIRPLVDSVPELPPNVRAPRYEFSNIASLGAMLSTGLGISALPELAIVFAQHPDLVCRPLAGPPLERELGIITRKGRSLSPAAQGLCEAIRESVGRCRSMSVGRAAAERGIA